jgi:predicted MFS family arabinose efflux permease
MEEIEHLYTLYSYAAMLVLVLMIILMREKPPSPPSAGAEESKMGVMASFGVIKNDRNLWKFFSAYIIIYSTLLSFGSISNFLVKPYGFEDVEIAVFGLCTIFSGVLGSILFSVYIKKTGNYYRTIRVMIFCSLTFFILYTVVLNLSAVLGIIIVLVLCLGFVFTPIVPVSYDLGC